jgi:serine-type D-Ala-D-Ala carboxypeptidase/endopeptidase
MKRLFLAFLLAAFVVVTAMARSTRQSPMPTDSGIRDILVQRIDTMHRSVGIVVGLIDPGGRRIIAYGHLNQGDARLPDGDTVFEIGSITKVFTSLLLSDMVERGQVALTDPVAKYLPPTVEMPQRNGKQITLLDLATHTSGLPRMPSNFAPKDMGNPYADYSDAQLYEFLSSYELKRDIGSQYEYSNLGGGLLGLALARRAGMDYGSLVRTRICDPLGMNNTRIALTPEMKAQLATGHDPMLKPVENWDLPTAFAGAGALRSTTNDMLTFLAANIGLTKTPLAPAMAAMLTARRSTGVQDLEIALGWHIFTAHGREIVWHNGGTGGYRSFIGFDLKSRVGVAVLSNAETPEGVDDIGRHLLDPEVPLMKPRSERKEINIDPKIFDGYVGNYQLAPNVMISMTRDGDHLYTQLTGQARFEIFPESETDFFLKVVDAQVIFVTNSQGKATEIILHQNGIDQHAKRVEGAPPGTPGQHKEVAVDPKVFDGYVGTYQLAPAFAITITRDRDRLFGQATNQPKFELFPEGEKDYFLKVVDARITFVTDAQGKATELILHQGGMDVHGKRVP